MTIVLDSDRESVSKVARHLDKLVNVLSVEDVSECALVARNLALIKVRVNGGSRAEVMQIVDTFRAHVVDVALDSLMIEATGTEEKVDGLIQVLESFGIVEMAQGGRVAMVRGSQQ